MALLRRQKSKKQKAADAITGYLKLKTASKAAKGAGKAAKGTAVQVSKRTSWRSRIPMIAGAGLAALAAFKLTRGRGGDPAAA
jgi:hypothetical protein